MSSRFSSFVTGLLLLMFLSLGMNQQVFASEGTEESSSEHATEATAFNPAEMIVHHIKDAHEWHLFSTDHGHVSIPLPIILYSDLRGLYVFLSSDFISEGGEHGHGPKKFNGFILDEHDHITSENPQEKILDFSLTKNAASIILSAFILISIFMAAGASARKNGHGVPTGIQSVFEPIVVFVRDEIAKPNLGDQKYMSYLPYLLTVFFFIWINNLLGLVPTGANASGNTSFTLTLAFFTAVITNFSGKKYYWKHIFSPPGVPWWLLIIMVPVELLGILTKPIALLIRLFANITAGHCIVLSIISFIFIFKTAWVGLASVPFALVMNVMEFFVAALQAYVFTLLSALFIGQAIEDHGHEHSHEGHH